MSKSLLLENEEEIRQSANLSMIAILEEVVGDERAYIEARKKLAESEVDLGDGITGHLSEEQDVSTED